MMRWKRCARVVWLILLIAGAAAQARVSATPLNRAGLLVRFADATFITRCVAFSAERITGIDLLTRAGLAIETVASPGLGELVCKIDREGCPASACLCAYPPAYWHYWLRGADGWQSAPLGASTRTLGHGDADAWSWGAGGGNALLPDLAFADICAARLYLPLVLRGGSTL